MSGLGIPRTSFLSDNETLFSLRGSCSHALFNVIWRVAWSTILSLRVFPKYPQLCTKSSNVPGFQSLGPFCAGITFPRGAAVGLVDQPSFLMEVLNAAKLPRNSPSRNPSMSDVVWGPRNGNRGRAARAKDCLIG